MLSMMTSDATVVEASKEYLPWLLLMPLIGCAAFTWDGIYIGATASKAIRNSMLWAVVAFAFVWFAGILCLDFSAPVPAGLASVAGAGAASVADAASGAGAASGDYGRAAMHILMAAYFAHLLARTIYLSILWRRTSTSLNLS